MKRNLKPLRIKVTAPTEIFFYLCRYRAQNKPVSKNDFTDTLDGSWKEIYERIVKKHPAVEYVYDARMDVLRQAGIELFPFLVEPTAVMILERKSFSEIPA